MSGIQPPLQTEQFGVRALNSPRVQSSGRERPNLQVVHRISAGAHSCETAPLCGTCMACGFGATDAWHPAPRCAGAGAARFWLTAPAPAPAALCAVCSPRHLLCNIAAGRAAGHLLTSRGTEAAEAGRDRCSCRASRRLQTVRQPTMPPPGSSREAAWLADASLTAAATPSAKVASFAASSTDHQHVVLPCRARGGASTAAAPQQATRRG